MASLASSSGIDGGLGPMAVAWSTAAVVNRWRRLDLAATWWLSNGEVWCHGVLSVAISTALPWRDLMMAVSEDVDGISVDVDVESAVVADPTGGEDGGRWRICWWWERQRVKDLLVVNVRDMKVGVRVRVLGWKRWRGRWTKGLGLFFGFQLNFEQLFF